MLGKTKIKEAETIQSYYFEYQQGDVSQKSQNIQGQLSFRKEDSNRRYYTQSQLKSNNNKILQEKIEQIPNELVCFTCLSDSFSLQKYIKQGFHEGHQIIRLAQSYEIIEQKLQTLQKSISLKNMRWRANKEKLYTNKKQLLSILKQLKNNIKQNFESIRTSLELKQVEFIRNAEILISNKFQFIDNYQQKATKALKDLEQLSNVFQHNKQIKYEKYVTQKKMFDKIFPGQQPIEPKNLEIDLSSIQKLLKQLDSFKIKITNMKTINFQNTFSIQSFSDYQICQKDTAPRQSTKKIINTVNRPTFQSFGDDFKSVQQSTTLFSSNAQTKKKISESNKGKKENQRPQIEQKQLNGMFQIIQQSHKDNLEAIRRLNSHKQDFHSSKKLKSRSSSNKMQEVKQFLKNPFRK